MLLTIISSNSGSVQQCIHYLSPRKGGYYTDRDVALIADYYFRHCDVAGIDAIMAFAQMCHETGNLTSWWSQRPRRNPAGIGVTGARGYNKGGWAWNEHSKQYEEGISFLSWDMSVRAHIGRLLAYAINDWEANIEQQILIDYALIVRPLPSKYRGRVKTWPGLSGKWAVDTMYSTRIISIAERIARI